MLQVSGIQKPFLETDRNLRPVRLVCRIGGRWIARTAGLHIEGDAAALALAGVFYLHPQQVHLIASGKGLAGYREGVLFAVANWYTKDGPGARKLPVLVGILVVTRPRSDLIGRN